MHSIDRVPILFIVSQKYFQSLNANMATVHCYQSPCQQFDHSFAIPIKPQGPSINDVKQVGGRGVCFFVTLCMKVQVKHPFQRDRGGIWSKLRDVIYECPLSRTPTAQVSTGSPSCTTLHSWSFKLAFSDKIPIF